MSKIEETQYWVPEHVREYLRSLGFVLPLEAMEPYIRSWHEWMSAVGDFYDYRDADGFGMGTGAWALWVDADARKVRIRHYDARMVLPLSWDEEGVSECAFVTRVFYRGKAFDQLQMHLRGGMGLDGGQSSQAGPSPSQSSSHGNASPDPTPHSRSFPSHGNEGTYKIVTVLFDTDGSVIDPAGVCVEYETGSPFPTFSIVKPAIDNTRVDMSPYGQSVFADAIDAVQAVDLTFDALINEVDISKMRVFLSDVMFDQEKDGTGKKVTIPFGKSDCTVFRKITSTDDMIQEFAPALRTSSQAEAFRISLQMLGDLTGFGIEYFDFDNSGYIRTATEVSSDNSQLMRNIARHEHALETSIANICHALMCVCRNLGEQIPDEGLVRVDFDDSIVTDTAAEKRLAMSEVGVTMHPYEYRMRFYGEDEATARERARGLDKAAATKQAGA